MIDVNITTLGSLAEVRSGYPFRGPVPAVENGPVRVVQMRDVDPAGEVDWSGVASTELEGRKDPDWIAPGDVLFASRGYRYYAACVDSVPGPAVCGQHLFHISVRPSAPVLPSFLAWQINQPPLQKLLDKMAEGSSQLSIRRGVLESLPIALPTLAAQHKIVELVRLAKRETAAYTSLIRIREKQLESLAEGLAQNLTPTSHQP